jgi:hypothetical protein
MIKPRLKGGGLGFDSRRGLGIFLLTTASRTADRSPQSSADVKNTWSYTSTPQYAFMAWWSVLKKYKGNFAFIFLPIPATAFVQQHPRSELFLEL